jgi:hypothetical protein
MRIRIQATNWMRIRIRNTAGTVNESLAILLSLYLLSDPYWSLLGPVPQKKKNTVILDPENCHLSSANGWHFFYKYS